MLTSGQAIRVAILCLISLVDSLGFNIFVNILPVLADPTNPLHFDGAGTLNQGYAYSILQFSFCLGVAVFPPFVGRWSDRRGRRPLLVWCLTLLSVSYFLQGCVSTFWVFSAVRMVAGVSGCLRPLAIAYIADMITDDRLRSKLITSLSLLSAFAVGFGPALGAHLVGMNRSYPFIFMGSASSVCVILVIFMLPEVKLQRVTLSAPTSPRCSSTRKKFVWTYRYLLTLGFSTYFMAMVAASAFPLSLKDAFSLDPFPAALCSIADGPLIFISNFVFMHYLTTLSSGCKASIVASAAFTFIAFVPETTAVQSLPFFLSLKYLTSIAGPIVFSAIAQTMMTVCPKSVCGSYAGLLTFFHGAGRLTATAIVGPMFHRSPPSVYLIVAITGAVSAAVFALLYMELGRTIGKVELKTPLLSVDTEQDMLPPISRQLSLLYPGTPAGGEFRLLAND